MSEYPVPVRWSSSSSQPRGGGADRVILLAEWLESVAVLPSAWPVAVYSQQALPAGAPSRCSCAHAPASQCSGVAAGGGSSLSRSLRRTQCSTRITGRVGRRAAHFCIFRFRRGLADTADCRSRTGVARCWVWRSHAHLCGTGSTDMRLGFNGLYALVVGKLQQNPQSGHLFCSLTSAVIA